MVRFFWLSNYSSALRIRVDVAAQSLRYSMNRQTGLMLCCYTGCIVSQNVLRQQAQAVLSSP